MTDQPAPLGNGAVEFAATPTGLPYPLSTDPANQGANAIKALALELDNRTPYQVYAISGGWSTNAQGGIAITLPFAVVVLALCTLVGTGAILLNRSSGAPANTVWINGFNSTNGASLVNTFIAMDIVVMGHN